MIINTDLIYPVGSIYMSANNTNPSVLFGGTWEQISKGRFLIGAGTNIGNTSNYFGECAANQFTLPLNERGGEYYHKLTTQEMPSHKHHKLTWDATGIGLGQVQAGSGTRCLGVDGVLVQDYNPWTNPQGGDAVHNNVPPYEAVNIRKRIA